MSWRIITNIKNRKNRKNRKTKGTSPRLPIRTRMHADGYFIFPVIVEDDGNSFTFRAVQTNDGKMWQVAFTSQAEFEKGEKSQVISNFIDSTLRGSLDTDITGFIINPWGQSFMLAKGLIEITAELLEGGAFLKRAVGICNRNRTQLNMIKLLRILRDSWVWVPCNAIMSDADYEIMEKAVKAAEAGEGLDSSLEVQDED